MRPCLGCSWDHSWRCWMFLVSCIAHGVVTVLKRSCGKVMFLHLSVILSTGRGVWTTACWDTQPPANPPGRHPLGQTPSPADTPRADTPPSRRLLLRTVCILLQCILVMIWLLLGWSIWLSVSLTMYVRLLTHQFCEKVTDSLPKNWRICVTHTILMIWYF